jgi:hypothetical protein
MAHIAMLIAGISAMQTSADIIDQMARLNLMPSPDIQAHDITKQIKEMEAKLPTVKEYDPPEDVAQITLDALIELEEAGARVEYFSTDVSDDLTTCFYWSEEHFISRQMTSSCEHVVPCEPGGIIAAPVRSDGTPDLDKTVNLTFLVEVQ